MGLTKTRNDERQVAETLIYLLLRQGVGSLPDKVYFLATCQENSMGLVAQKVQPLWDFLLPYCNQILPVPVGMALE